MGAVADRPHLVSWNLTRNCNLSCPHCYLDASSPSRPGRGRYPGGELSRSEALGVVEELSSLSPGAMLILSGGEPMLRPDLFEIVESAHMKGFITVLGTNGTLLTGEHLRRLKRSGLKGVGVSLDSSEPTSHDSFRGLQGAWNLSTAALKLAREEGLETQLEITLGERNWGEIDALVELGAGLGAKAANFFLLIGTGRAREANLSAEHYEAALKHLARLARTESRLMVRARCAPHIYRLFHEEGFSTGGGSRGCPAGRSYLRIDPEGNVTPCPYLPFVIGNVRENSLAALWQDAPDFRRMREGSYLGRCGRCAYREICGGCRARAFIEKADLMEEDPLCAYEPSGMEEVIREEGFASSLPWEGKARERMQRIPPFIRGRIIRLTEEAAGRRGLDSVTCQLLDELKGQLFHGKTGG